MNEDKPKISTETIWASVEKEADFLSNKIFILSLVLSIACIYQGYAIPLYAFGASLVGTLATHNLNVTSCAYWLQENYDKSRTVDHINSYIDWLVIASFAIGLWTIITMINK